MTATNRPTAAAKAGKYKLAFTTLACPEWSWSHIVHETERLGYDGIEIRGILDEMDLLQMPPFSKERRAATLEDLTRRGITLCGLGSSVRFDTADTFDQQIQEGKAVVDLAVALGVPFVRVFGDRIPSPEDEARIIAQVSEGLNRLGDYSQGRGVHILIETHGDFSLSSRLLQVMERVQSPAVGVLWDMHHPWRFFQEPLETTYRALFPWVRHIHVKDSLARADGEGFTYTLTGEGEFPFDEAFALLDSSGYDGFISFEWEKRWHPDLEPPEVALPHFMSYAKRML